MPHSSERIIEIYERYALEWDADRNRRSWHDKGWHDRFITCLTAGASVLDLGCGSGMPVAHHLVQLGLHVTGVDTSPTLIDLCRRRMPQQEWMVSDMRTVALHRHFDGILGWDSFFHLTPDDQRKVFDVFAAHAAPGAFLLFNTGPRQGEAIGEYQGEPLYHSSLDPAEYQLLLDRSGFDVVAHVVEDPMAGGRTIWLAQARKQSSASLMRITSGS
ncbi:MAG TPA: class I SAM-dependent methyltransferase [Ktedonobacteraceae bacterium]